MTAPTTTPTERRAKLLQIAQLAAELSAGMNDARETCPSCGISHKKNREQYRAAEILDGMAGRALDLADNVALCE